MATNKQFTLLLVDDNPTNLLLLAQIIELDLPQVRVLTARSAKEGLALVEQQQVDGAFIDVQMPQISGLDMCRQLKADPRTTGMPLVLITAHIASPEMRAQGLEVGAYDFISQPISNIEMLARIKVMLRLCESEQAQSADSPNRAGDKQLPAKMRWINGLILSGEGQTAETDQQRITALAKNLPVPAEIDEQLFIDKILELLPVAWQQTFLKLALLRKVPFPLARKISDIEDIESAITYLRRQGILFTSADGGEEQVFFSAEALKRLDKKAELALGQPTRDLLLHTAADWFQLQKDLVAALECLLRAEDYAAISQLLSQAGLVLTAQRFQPRAFELLARVPDKIAAGCGWLSLYAGIFCLQRSPVDVNSWLELARTRFEGTGDKRGELLVLSRQVLQYLLADGQLELGLQQLARFRQLAAQLLPALVPENRLKVQFSLGMAELMFSGELAMADKYLQAGLAEAQREKLLEEQLDLSLLQVLLALYQGHFRVAHSACEQANALASRLSRQSLPVWAQSIVASELLFCLGDLPGFEKQKNLAKRQWEGQSLQHSAFGPLLNIFSVLNCLAQGRNEAAGEQLEIALKSGPAAYSSHFRSWILQLRGFYHAHQDSAAALTDMREALEQREQAVGGLNCLPNKLIAGATALLLRDNDLAKRHLEDGLQQSEKLKDFRYRGGFHAWLALLRLRQKNRKKVQAHLTALFDLLERQQTSYFYLQTPELVRELIPLTLGRADWRPFLVDMVNRCLDASLAESGRIVTRARLRTLGGFSLQIAGRTCDLSAVGPASRQMMGMLAVAPNGSLSIEYLMGILWPDSPPGKARNSFDTALSRLRKPLEDFFGKQIRQDYLILEKGVLLLRNVQIDCGEFTLLLERARRHLQRQNFWQAEISFWKADSFWQGEFLAGFDLDAELPYSREDLTQMRLEQLSGLARILHFRGDTAEAVHLLKLGLQLVPTQDSLVQQLLPMYHKLGEKRAIKQLLENFRQALEAEDYTPEEISELLEMLKAQGHNE